MKLRYLIIIVSFLISINSFGQIIAKQGEFKNLNEALIVNPDSVFSVSMGNSNLREFPIEILRFRNLEYINFFDFDIVDIYISDSLKLLVADRKLARKLYTKYWAGTSRVSDINNFPVRNRNLIKHIPDEIYTLKKLESIRFSKYQISCRQKKKLHKLLPNCEIEVLK